MNAYEKQPLSQSCLCEKELGHQLSACQVEVIRLAQKMSMNEHYITVVLPCFTTEAR